MTGQNQYHKVESEELLEYRGSHESEDAYDRFSAPKGGFIRHAISYTALILCNIAMLGLWLHARQSQLVKDDQCVRPKFTWSGPRDAGATKYERVHMTRPLDDNPFVGGPRPEHDEAWGKLVEPMIIKLTPEEYENANLGVETIGFADGSGYLGELAVYHELHCVKRIRRHLHLKHYYPDLSDNDYRIEGIHIEHCLEYLREAAMCHGDPTVATMFWRDALPTSRAHSDHECVNWDSLDSWARSRSVLVTKSVVEELNTPRQDSVERAARSDS
ncbi:hypothetical protein HYFRA_00013702 [Hymenoscyphus fraxineus]|uniref:Tat pathway signal sequence n=1 Tax=Hymenoscyphus fraxineus TaxID=746836 RepID=A0A9N9LED2_9HELO|nr:hypothetical protein HYFRA_00013702 [Hymenoscyphus fraxineus]